MVHRISLPASAARRRRAAEPREGRAERAGRRGHLPPADVRVLPPAVDGPHQGAGGHALRGGRVPARHPLRDGLPAGPADHRVRDEGVPPQHPLRERGRVSGHPQEGVEPGVGAPGGVPRRDGAPVRPRRGQPPELRRGEHGPGRRQDGVLDHGGDVHGGERALHRVAGRGGGRRRRGAWRRRLSGPCNTM